MQNTPDQERDRLRALYEQRMKMRRDARYPTEGMTFESFLREAAETVIGAGGLMTRQLVGDAQRDLVRAVLELEKRNQ